MSAADGNGVYGESTPTNERGLQIIQLTIWHLKAKMIDAACESSREAEVSDTFDAEEFKRKMRSEWRSAAEGWRKWHDVVEAEEGGKLHSARLVQLAGIGPGDTVLDVAGGYGEPALTAARVVGPNGRVVCTDISGEMLAFGRERAAMVGLNNVEFLERDAEELEFPPESFSAVLSRAGLMFLPDVAGALRRFHSFLRPGGRLAASVWGPPPDVQFAAGFPIIMEELKLPPPPPGQPGVSALSDPRKLVDLVADAGFRDIETGTLTVVFTTSSPDEYTEFIRDVAPAMNALVDGQPSDVQKRIWGRITEVWKQFQQADGRVRTENQAIWVAGTK
jgi:enediyne biosynthesis protein CalE5